jgi:hypothetical protein
VRYACFIHKGSSLASKKTPPSSLVFSEGGADAVSAHNKKLPNQCHSSKFAAIGDTVTPLRLRNRAEQTQLSTPPSTCGASRVREYQPGVHAFFYGETVCTHRHWFIRAGASGKSADRAREQRSLRSGRVASPPTVESHSVERGADEDFRGAGSH